MSVDDTRTDAHEGFARARAVADAVLYEGYLLYPYRSTSGKNSANQVRWQFGVVGPQGAHAAGAGEDADLRTECLLAIGSTAGEAARVDIRLRFLQVQTRSVEQLVGGELMPVAELRSGTSTWVGWDEAVETSVDLIGLAVDDLVQGSHRMSIEVAGGEDVEPLREASGVEIGRLRRRRWPLLGSLEVSAVPVPVDGDGDGDGDGDRNCLRLRVSLHNTGSWAPGGNRDQALRQSFLSAHLVLAARESVFVSLLEPPDWAAEAAQSCENYRCWPVLIGEEGSGSTSDTVLASPIILYDWPQIAADSAGDLFDATEIDEILTLRVMTMTDEEKRQARATDPRAAAIVDRCEQITPEALGRLHGGSSEVSPPTFTTEGTPWWDPGVDASVSPGTDTVEVRGVAVAKGSTVRLHPSRRADAQDLFFAGQAATVAAVHHDVDGNVHVAVTIDDDPAADLHDWYGRYLYFGPEELEPVGGPG